MPLDGKYLSHGELTVVDTVTGNDNYQCKDTLGCIVSQVVNPFTGVSRKTPFSRSFLSEFHEDNENPAYSQKERREDLFKRAG